MNYLLTPDSFKKKLLSKEFQQDLNVYIQAELRHMLNSNKTVNEFLQEWGIAGSQENLQVKIDAFIERKYEQWMEEYREQPMRNLLPVEISAKVESKLPFISAFILQKELIISQVTKEKGVSMF